MLAPQVSGYVSSVEVKDFRRVKAGQLLVQIDDRICRQQLDKAQHDAEIAAREADLLQAKVGLISMSPIRSSRAQWYH